MYFELLFFASLAFGICCVPGCRREPPVWVKQYAAAWAGAAMLALLSGRVMFSSQQLLCAGAAAGGIAVLWNGAGKIRRVVPGLGLGIMPKIAAAAGIYFFVVKAYAPEENSGQAAQETIRFFFWVLSALLLFSGQMKRMLEPYSVWSGAFVFVVPVWGFYIIERVRNAQMDQMGWLYVTGNIAVLALLYGCLHSMLPWKKFAAGLFLTVCLLFGLANYYVMQFKGNPVMPSDLLSLNTAFQVAGGYEIVITEPAAAGVLHWYAAVSLLCVLPAGRGTVKWKLRAAACSLSVILCADALAGWNIEKQYELDSIDQWTVNNFYNEKGSVLGFAELMKKLKIRAPDGYETRQAEALLEENAQAGTPSRKTGSGAEPAVIVVMDESFADLRTLGDFACSGQYLEKWYAADDFACRGNLYVSTYGGGTANTEFEFLTGNSIANCGSGTVPYQIYDLSNVGNLAGLLAAQGYETAAVHPQYKGNWNRMRTYANFGFEQFLGIDDFEDPVYMRSHISDASSFEKVIELYEQNPQRQFIFNVTMQNHGGYQIEEMAGIDTIKLEGEQKIYTDVETYLTLIQESDLAVKNLLDYFRGVDEPVIVCIFGDHHPNVSAEWTERVMGKQAEELSLEEVQKKYAVPYMIWANFDTPYRQCTMDTSANYLGALLLENAGLAQSAYTGFLLRMREEIPVFNAFGYQDAGGAWHALDEADAGGWIADYRTVQYYAMFDKKRSGAYFR